MFIAAEGRAGRGVPIPLLEWLGRVRSFVWGAQARACGISCPLTRFVSSRSRSTRRVRCVDAHPAEASREGRISAGPRHGRGTCRNSRFPRDNHRVSSSTSAADLRLDLGDRHDAKICLFLSRLDDIQGDRVNMVGPFVIVRGIVRSCWYARHQFSRSECGPRALTLRPK